MVLKLNVKFVITLHLCSLYVCCVYRDDCWKSACIQHSLMAIQKYFEAADLYEFAHLYVLVLLSLPLHFSSNRTFWGNHIIIRIHTN